MMRSMLKKLLTRFFGPPASGQAARLSWQNPYQSKQTSFALDLLALPACGGQACPLFIPKGSKATYWTDFQFAN